MSDEAVRKYIAWLATAIRQLPTPELLDVLWGALIVAGDNAAMDELRPIYASLRHCDQQLELIAGQQLKLPLSNNGDTSPSPGSGQ